MNRRHALIAKAEALADFIDAAIVVRNWLHDGGPCDTEGQPAPDDEYGAMVADRIKRFDRALELLEAESS